MCYHFLQILWPKIRFRYQEPLNTWYLTFDDGPTPIVTQWVLDILSIHNIKATFCCIGSHIDSHKEIFERILANGHAVANHSYSHLSSWKVSIDDYQYDIEKCQTIYPFTLFRPPYGKMGWRNYHLLKKKYTILLYSKIARDWDVTIDPTCKIQSLIQSASDGDIFLFHDNEKSFENLKIMLPILIDYAIRNNINFGVCG